MKNTAIFGLLFWLLGSLFFFAEYFVRVSTGVLAPAMTSEFHASATAIGMLSAFFYYAYISMQIPVGIIVDRYGAKPILVIMTAIFGVCCILFSSMPNIELGYVYRFLMGFSGAFAFVGTLKLATVYFKPHLFELLAGITQSLGMLGAIIGDAPISYAIEHFGWRHTMFSVAGVFFAISVSLLILVPNRKNNNNSIAVVIQSATDKQPIWHNIKYVLSIKAVWLNCIFIGCLYGPTVIFGEQWGSIFCKTVLHISLTESAFMVSMIFFGLAIGCPLIGFISSRLNNKIRVMRYSALVCLIILVITIYGSILGINLPHLLLQILFFTYGIFNSAIVVSYALSTRLVKNASVAGVTLGITNMASIIIGSLIVPITGFVLDKLSQHNNAVVFSSSNFGYAFLIMPICLLISILVTFQLQDPDHKHWG